MTTLPWVHVNEATLDEMRAILPGIDMEDGYCGREWSEEHVDCPATHVEMRNVPVDALSIIMREGIPFYADLDDTIGERTAAWNWREPQGECGGPLVRYEEMGRRPIDYPLTVLSDIETLAQMLMDEED